jgi:hypothetical protein
MSPRSNDERITRLEEDQASLRERLTRVETLMASHEAAAVRRHAEVLDLVREVRSKQEHADRRSWMLTVGLLAVGMFGGAGAAEWVRALL